MGCCLGCWICSVYGEWKKVGPSDWGGREEGVLMVAG